MKKISILLATFVMLVLFTVTASAIEQTGQCGDNVFWDYNSETGELVISGNGYMYDYHSLADSPFYNSEIKSITIKENVTTIGDFAFMNCKELLKVEMSDDITIIGKGAFYHCTELADSAVSDNVTAIGYYAFYGCENLSAITIPDSVTYIGSDAFYGCKNLSTVTINDIENWCRIDFYNQKSNPLSCAHRFTINDETVEEIVIPDTITEIKQYAFYGLSGTGSITIPASVSDIHDDVFSYLDNIIIHQDNKNYSNDESGAVFDKAKTTILKYPGSNTDKEYSIPDSVTTIGTYAFRDNKKLTSIVIPDSVTVIDDQVFSGCSSLTDVVIPDSVTAIGIGAFHSCSAIKSIVIPDSVTVIGNYAFNSCSSLETIIIPDTAISIGNDVFNDTKYYKNSSNWEDSDLYIGNHLITTNTDETIYSVKEGTLTIAAEAINDTDSYITDLIIPDSVLFISDKAIYDFPHGNIINSITVDKNNKNYSSDEYGVLFDKEKTKLIYYPASNVADSYSIPDSVTTIADYAFRGSANLVNLTIPDSVTTIGRGAFISCKKLTDISIPASVTDINEPSLVYCKKFNVDNKNYSVDEYGVLFNKEKTELIRFPAYSDITSYNIPDSVTIIGDGAFSGCKNLLSVTIPDSVTTIGASAFSLCENITDIIIGNSVTVIGASAFNSCGKLRALMLPETVREIEKNAFSQCSNLKYMTIYNNLEYIGINAFFSSYLDYIYFAGTKSEWKDITKKHEDSTGPAYLNLPEIIYVDDTHLNNVYENITASPTCTENGVKEIWCACGCNLLIRNKEIEATGHDMQAWENDYDACIATRKCKNCDYNETTQLEDQGDGDVEIIAPGAPDLDFDVDSIDKNNDTFVLVEQSIKENTTVECEVLKVFDITLKNHDGVHVQPDGTVKVKLPLDWEKEGNYKVYRVNDDGTLTDMNAYRQGSHMVFDTDHFSIYVIVEEATTNENENHTNDFIDFVKQFIEALKGFFEKILELFSFLKTE